MEPLSKPDLDAVLMAIQSHHAMGQDCHLFAKDAELLVNELRRELPECAVEVKELANGRKTLLVRRPVTVR